MKLKIIGIMAFMMVVMIPVSVFADDTVVDKNEIMLESNFNEVGNYYLDPRSLIDGKFVYKNGWDNQYHKYEKAYVDFIFNEKIKLAQIKIALSSGLTEYQPREGFDVYISVNGVDFSKVFGVGEQYFSNVSNNVVKYSIDVGDTYVEKVRIKYRGNGNRGRITELDFLKKKNESMNPYDGMLNAYDYIDEEMTDIQPPNEVENIEYQTTLNSVTISYVLPSDSDFDHVIINIDGNIYTTSDGSIFVNELDMDREYSGNIKTVDISGNVSEGKKISFRTQSQVVDEVRNLKAKANHNEVDLSWDMPADMADLHHVNIYRKEISNDVASVFDFFKPMKVNAAEGYEPIFQTNGTFFNDLTVDAAQEYEYKLTTETEDGRESDGVTIKTKTLLPVIEGGGHEKNENGDYVIKWDEPTKGEVEIVIDGEIYDKVPAEDGQIVIPSEDMPELMGQPDYSIRPIAPNGTEGNTQNSEGAIDKATLPFDVTDLVTSGFALLGLVGGFVLLGLAFVFLPKVIALIRKSIVRKNEKKMGRRR